MSGYGISGLGFSTPLCSLNGSCRESNRMSTAEVRSAVRGDSISLSDEALARYREFSGLSSEAPTAPRKVLGEESERSGGPAGSCEFSRPGDIAIAGETINVIDKLMELAKEDFGKFTELMDKLKSGDATQMLDALGQLLDVKPGEVREALEKMDTDVETFVGDLLKAMG